MDFDLVGNLSSSAKEPDQVLRSGLVGKSSLPSSLSLSLSLSLPFPPSSLSLSLSLSFVCFLFLIRWHGS